VTSDKKNILNSSKVTALLLGFSGLLPIATIFIAAIIWPTHLAKLGTLANIYAGSIFSFLGGIQWGLGLNGDNNLTINKRLIVSTLPTLWTVLALQLNSAGASWALVIGLNALLLFELFDPERYKRPKWYLPLRINLTIGLSLGLFAISALFFSL
jgi:hypothetical protein